MQMLLDRVVDLRSGKRIARQQLLQKNIDWFGALRVPVEDSLRSPTRQPRAAEAFLLRRPRVRCHWPED
jgi:hypothetical protein